MSCNTLKKKQVHRNYWNQLEQVTYPIRHIMNCWHDLQNNMVHEWLTSFLSLHTRGCSSSVTVDARGPWATKHQTVTDYIWQDQVGLVQSNPAINPCWSASSHLLTKKQTYSFRGWSFWRPQFGYPKIHQENALLGRNTMSRRELRHHFSSWETSCKWNAAAYSSAGMAHVLHFLNWSIWDLLNFGLKPFANHAGGHQSLTSLILSRGATAMSRSQWAAPNRENPWSTQEGCWKGDTLTEPISFQRSLALNHCVVRLPCILVILMLVIIPNH